MIRGFQYKKAPPRPLLHTRNTRVLARTRLQRGARRLGASNGTQQSQLRHPLFQQSSTQDQNKLPYFNLYQWMSQGLPEESLSQQGDFVKWIQQSGLNTKNQAELTAEVVSLRRSVIHVKTLVGLLHKHLTKELKGQLSEQDVRLVDRLLWQAGRVDQGLAEVPKVPRLEKVKLEKKRAQILAQTIRQFVQKIIAGEIPPRPKAAHAKPVAPRKQSNHLVSRPRSRAMGLSLWNHQSDVLRSIDRYQKAKRVEPDLYNAESEQVGIVALPTGGGKTRLMFATAAMNVNLGYVDLSQGDKIIFTTHLKTIGAQTLDNIKKVLLPLLKEKAGRDVTVSCYDGKHKDTSGDIVLVSIPTVNTESRLKQFDEALKESLQDGAKVPLMLIDEVHHADARTWNSLIGHIKEFGDHETDVIGFTATPTEEQSINLVNKEANWSAIELMYRGILPECEIVSLNTGQSFVKLKTTKSGEVSQKDHNLINTKERNQMIVESLADYALKTTDGRGFQTILGFGLSVQHAANLASMHVKTYGLDEEMITRRIERASRKGESLTREQVIAELRAQNPNPLYNRNITLVEANAKKGVLQKAIQDKKEGLIDAIVVVVDGHSRFVDELIDAAKQGLIEAVYNCKKFEEGVDAYWARNLVGAKPTFSPVQRAQEVGRLFRREPGEVDYEQGVVVKAIQRRILDYRDGGVPTVEYREVIGLKHVYLSDGEVYDVVKQRKQRPTKKQVQRKDDSSSPEDEIDLNTIFITQDQFTQLQSRLNKILEEQFHANIDAMAAMMGLESDDLLAILVEDYVAIKPSEVQQYEYLLYLDANDLVLTLVGSAKHMVGADHLTRVMAIDAISQSLDLYLSIKGLPRKPQKLTASAGEAEIDFNLTKGTFTTLEQYQFSLNFFRKLASLLYYALKGFIPKNPGDPLAKTIQNQFGLLRQSLNLYSLNEEPVEGLLGQMFWDRTLQSFHEVFENLSLDQRKVFWLNFIKEKYPDLSDKQIHKENWVLVGGASGVRHDQRISGGVTLIRTSELSEAQKRINYPKIHVTLSEQGQLFVDREKFGGYQGKNAFNPIGFEMVKAGLIVDENLCVTNVILQNLTNEKPEKLRTNKARILSAITDVIEERGYQVGEELVLVGGSGGVNKNQKIAGGLELIRFSELSESQKNKYYPKVYVRMSGQGQLVVDHKQHGGYEGLSSLYPIGTEMVKAGLIVDDNLCVANIELQNLTNEKPEKFRKNKEALTNLIAKVIEERKYQVGEVLVFVSGAGGAQGNKKITGGLELIRFSELSDLQKDYSYSKIYVQLGVQGQLVVDCKQNGGYEGVSSLYPIGTEMVNAGLIVDDNLCVANIELQNLTNEKPEKLGKNKARILSVIADVIAERDYQVGEELVLVAGSGGLKGNQKITGGLELIRFSELSEAQKKVSYPKIYITLSEQGQLVVNRNRERGYHGKNSFNPIGIEMVKAGLIRDVMFSEANLVLQNLTKIKPEKLIENREEILKTLADVIKEKGYQVGEELVFVGGAGGLKGNQKITGGLELIRFSELSEVKVSGGYPKVYVKLDQQGRLVVDRNRHNGYQGPSAFDPIGIEMVKAGLIRDVMFSEANWVLQNLTKIKPEKLSENRKEILKSLTDVIKEKGYQVGEKLVLVGGAGGVYHNQKISGGLELIRFSELSEAQENGSYPKIHVTVGDEGQLVVDRQRDDGYKGDSAFNPIGIEMVKAGLIRDMMYSEANLVLQNFTKIKPEKLEKNKSRILSAISDVIIERGYQVGDELVLVGGAGGVHRNQKISGGLELIRFSELSEAQALEYRPKIFVILDVEGRLVLDQNKGFSGANAKNIIGPALVEAAIIHEAKSKVL